MAAEAVKTAIPAEPTAPMRTELIVIMVVVAIFAVIYLG